MANKTDCGILWIMFVDLSFVLKVSYFFPYDFFDVGVEYASMCMCVWLDFRF